MEEEPKTIKRTNISDTSTIDQTDPRSLGSSKRLCQHPTTIELPNHGTNRSIETHNESKEDKIDQSGSKDLTPNESNLHKDRRKFKKKASKKLQRLRDAAGNEGSPLTSERSLELGIKDLLGHPVYQALIDRPQGDTPAWKACGWDLETHHPIQVTISALSSFGDGIAISPNKDWALIVPFSVPGDVVETKVFRHNLTHSLGDFIRVVSPGPWRNDDLIRCQYFGKCSGCQYQMIDYSIQLDLKRTTVQKAFEYFSGLDEAEIPTVEPTLSSPKQYGYRTKLTPHFELPRKLKSRGASQISGSTPAYDSGPGGLAIGLAEKGRRRVVDIEECPLGTQTINQTLKTERARVQSTIETFKRGATLLLRESLIPIDPNSSEPIDDQARICVTDHKKIVREKVLDKHFQQNAGSFFQNNPSILGPFLSYMIDELILPTHKIPRVGRAETSSDDERYLVDAYCGSGLFSISLAHHFTQTIGIELASDSLHYAKENAKLNKVDNAQFIVGQAQAIFKDLKFPSDRTTMIIDPPRKGCDQEFLEQLLNFKPEKVIYISCNVHTQARDIKSLKASYRIDRLRPLDFFPQTYHCESVALLSLIP